MNWLTELCRILALANVSFEFITYQEKGTLALQTPNFIPSVQSCHFEVLFFFLFFQFLVSQDLSIRGWKNSLIFLRLTLVKHRKDWIKAKNYHNSILKTWFQVNHYIKWIPKKLCTDMTVKIIKIYGSHPPTNLGTGRLN